MGRIKEFIRCLIKNPSWFYNISTLDSSCKKVVLIGTPIHGNLGDHLIAEEEKAFLNDYFSEYTFIECVMPIYLAADKIIKNACNRDDLIFISGGGWMGNLWLEDEFTIRNIVSSYLENPVVIFPQTAYYTDDENGSKVLQKTINVLKKHKRLFIMLRDYKSYLLMKDRLEGTHVKVGYYPDMALYGHCFENEDIPFEVEKNIFICLREDIEANVNRNEIIKCLINDRYDINKFTTVKKRRIYPADRYEELMKMRREIFHAQCIVTDRLHAMVFSVLNGVPCCAIDNKTRKVSGVYDWIKDTGMVTMIKDTEDICSQISNINKTHKKYSRDLLREYYEDMAVDIRNMI